MNPENLPGNEPWITKQGFFDSTKFPIDNVLKHALSDDDRVFRSGLRTLRLMIHHGRIEAGVFLLGLLVNYEDNWEKRIEIVEALKGIDTQGLRITIPGLTHHNSGSGLYGKFRIPNKLKLLPYSLATFR